MDKLDVATAIASLSTPGLKSPTQRRVLVRLPADTTTIASISANQTSPVRASLAQYRASTATSMATSKAPSPT